MAVGLPAEWGTVWEEQEVWGGGAGYREKFLNRDNHLHCALCKSLCWRRGASKANTANAFSALKIGAKKRSTSNG